MEDDIRLEPPDSAPAPLVDEPLPLGIPAAVLASLAVIALQMVSGIVMGVAAALFNVATTGTLVFDLSTRALVLANLVAFAPVLYWGYYRNGGSLRRAFALRPAGAAILAAVLPLAVGGTILSSELDNLTRSLFPGLDIFADVMEQVFSEPWAALVAVVFVAPLTEEPMFRGLLMSGMRRQMSAWRAVLVSSALFGFIHVNPTQILPAFLIGLVLGWVLLRTSSLWPCVLVHALHNALPLALGWFLNVEITGLTTQPEQGVFQPFWLDILGVALFLLGVAALRSATAGRPTQPAPLDNQ